MCARQSAALKFAKSMFSLHTARVWAWLLPLPALVSTNHLTPAETKKRWRAPPHPRVWQLQYHLQLLPQFLHYKCTNYYRAAEGSVTSRCVVCSVTGSSGVTQLLAAVWCQCSLESLCPARRLLQLHRGRSVAREEALDTGACGFHIRWCVSLWIFIQYTVIWRVCLLSFVTNLLMLSPSNFPQYILLWRY